MNQRKYWKVCGGLRGYAPIQTLRRRMMILIFSDVFQAIIPTQKYFILQRQPLFYPFHLFDHKRAKMLPQMREEISKLCTCRADTHPRGGGSCAAGVTSSVVAVAVMTVVTTYLLCRPTAALGYTEVLAHLSVHSTHPGSPPGQLFTLSSGVTLIYGYPVRRETE